MSTFDRRRTAARPDLAAASLAGTVAADRFVEGTVHQVVEPVVALRSEPRSDAGRQTEALFGETVTVYETDAEGWAWGQLAGDRYVGYLPADALSRTVHHATHRVAVLRSFVYPGPNMKLSPLASLSLGSRVAVTAISGAFAQLASGGFVWAGHLAALAAVADDFVSVAERFVGLPYLWGGKSSLGLDCSGLVQLALDAAGIVAPRDSDMQAEELGEAIDASGPLRRGDLVFWTGHVGIMQDAETLLHAEGYRMLVTSESFAIARERIHASGFPVTGVRRLPTLGGLA